MPSIFVILMFACMVATVVIMLVGLGSMAVGGEFNKKYGNKLMYLRVGFQAATIALLGLVFIMS